MPESHIHAFFGTDEARVREAAHAVVRKLVPEGGEEFGLEIVEGQADNAEHALQICSRAVEAIQTIPFLGGAKTVWLKGANFFGEDRTGKAEATLEGQEHLLEVLNAGLPPDIHFVLSASAVHKGRRFYLGLKKLAKPQHLDRVDTKREGWQEQVMGLVRTRARERGLNFGSEALELFVMTVGEDTAQLDNELEKLQLYLGAEDREIGVEDVRLITSSTRAGVIFEVGNAIGKGDLAGAIRRVDYLLDRGENGIGILRATIIPEIRRQLGAATLRSHLGSIPGNYKSFQQELDHLPATATQSVPRSKDGKSFNAYPVFLALKGGQRYGVDHLATALAACLETDVRMVTTSIDHRLLLGRLLARIIPPRAAA